MPRRTARRPDAEVLGFTNGRELDCGPESAVYKQIGPRKNCAWVRHVRDTATEGEILLIAEVELHADSRDWGLTAIRASHACSWAIPRR